MENFFVVNGFIDENEWCEIAEGTGFLTVLVRCRNRTPGSTGDRYGGECALTAGI